MKDITIFIKESKSVYDKYNKYSKKLSELKDNDNMFCGWTDEDGSAYPMNVIIKKKGNKNVITNPDDANDEMLWSEFIGAGGTQDDPSLWIFKNLKQCEKACDEYDKEVNRQ